MSLVIGDVKPERKFELPSAGLHLAEIVSIKKVTQRADQYGDERSKVQFLWLMLDQKDGAGKWVSLVQRYTPSLGEKANLRKVLLQLGVTSPETFDLERLKGVKAQVVVSHAVSGERTFANIQTIVPGSVVWPQNDPSADADGELFAMTTLETRWTQFFDLIGWGWIQQPSGTLEATFRVFEPCDGFDCPGGHVFLARAQPECCADPDFGCGSFGASPLVAAWHIVCGNGSGIYRFEQTYQKDALWEMWEGVPA